MLLYLQKAAKSREFLPYFFYEDGINDEKLNYFGLWIHALLFQDFII